MEKRFDLKAISGIAFASLYVLSGILLFVEGLNLTILFSEYVGMTPSFAYPLCMGLVEILFACFVFSAGAVKLIGILAPGLFPKTGAFCGNSDVLVRLAVEGGLLVNGLLSILSSGSSSGSVMAGGIMLMLFAAAGLCLDSIGLAKKSAAYGILTPLFFIAVLVVAMVFMSTSYSVAAYSFLALVSAAAFVIGLLIPSKKAESPNGEKAKETDAAEAGEAGSEPAEAGK